MGGSRQLRISVLSLGCKVSQYDAAQLKEMLIRAGAEICSPSPESEAFILCGCAVTERAVKEAWQIARRSLRQNEKALFFFSGCIGAFLNRFRSLPSPEGILSFGPEEKRELFNALGLSLVSESSPAKRGWSRSRAFLKVQDGCDHFCSFCIVPFLRGPGRSRKLQEIMQEAENLVEGGYQEIVLTGVRLSAYGKDGKRSDLLELLGALQKIPNLKRIRLSSLEPMDLTPQMLDEFARFPKLCPHFHLPLQSGSDFILNRMKRGYNWAHYLALVEKIRQLWPRVAITTDIMVGFPGESEEDFAQTLKAVQIVFFARMHIFRYSPRPGTEAARLLDQVSEQIKRERSDRLRALAQTLSLSYRQQFLNCVLPVLVEKVTAEGEGEGLTDNYIRVKFRKTPLLKSGEIKEMRIVACETSLCRAESI